MATKFEKILGKTALSFLSIIVAYLAGVGLYTLIYGNEFLYNMGYSLGFIAGKITSFF